MIVRLLWAVLAISIGGPLPISGAGAQPPAATTGRPAPWTGHYTYVFDGGATMGGSRILVTYTLALDGAACRFQAEGFQVDGAIICTARPAGHSLDIRFKSYADGELTDRYGRAVYHVGDPLFTLSRRGSAVITQWKRYALPDDRSHRPGIYFRR